MTATNGDRPGRIVAAYGRHVVVEDEHGERFRCRLRGRRLRPVCVDNVRWQPMTGDASGGLVTEILDRRNELARPDARGRSEVIAANLSQLAVVVAPRPEPDPFLVDRYLAAAALMDVRGVVVANKADLGALGELLDEFSRVGYVTAQVSAKSGTGMEELRDLLRGQTSIFVGHSGVGKSSLLNALIPGLEARTNELSAASGEGRHTTTASILHHLEVGGEIIDSPGVRDFAPAPVPEREVTRGFIEFREAGPCRFADCRHLSEPDCAVKAGVTSGTIPARRYESYRRLVNRFDGLR